MGDSSMRREPLCWVDSDQQDGGALGPAGDESTCMEH
jgi:hypothetical protein